MPAILVVMPLELRIVKFIQGELPPKVRSLLSLISDLVQNGFSGELTVKFSEGGLINAFTLKREI